MPGQIEIEDVNESAGAVRRRAARIVQCRVLIQGPIHDRNRFPLRRYFANPSLAHLNVALTGVVANGEALRTGCMLPLRRRVTRWVGRAARCGTSRWRGHLWRAAGARVARSHRPSGAAIAVPTCPRVDGLELFQDGSLARATENACYPDQYRNDFSAHDDLGPEARE